ncbi:MAG: RNase adapter RapZ [Pseudomonadota bacterium]
MKKALPVDHRIVFVTGPSGAGRSTALRALEDLGFEVIDNMPLAFVPRLLAGPSLNRSLALGVDVRNRDFSVGAVFDAIETVRASEEFEPQLVFLTANPEVLSRRYSETRRRHPMSPESTADEGILAEGKLLDLLRARADILIDTSDMTPHDLAADVGKWFGPEGARILSVTLMSFSYKRGIPRGVDMVLDCRFLRNPHWDERLREKTGRDAAVGTYVKNDTRFEPFLINVNDLLTLLLPAYLDEGKAHFTLAFGCTGGKHRSVFLTETVAKHLQQAGWLVKVRHREI